MELLTLHSHSATGRLSEASGITVISQRLYLQVKRDLAALAGWGLSSGTGCYASRLGREVGNGIVGDIGMGRHGGGEKLWGDKWRGEELGTKRWC